MRFFIITLIVLLLLVLCSGSVAFSQVSDGIIIRIPARILELYKNGEIIKTYPVGVGRPEFPTPSGSFQIINMVITPDWENPYKSKGKVQIKRGSTNPLGTRWIGFKEYAGGQYGIHGTNNPQSVGEYSSHGCVRMFIKDSEDLFGRVYFGMPVIVIDKTSILKNVQETRSIKKIVSEKIPIPLILDNIYDVRFYVY